jgi:hypothetical protein
MTAPNINPDVIRVINGKTTAGAVTNAAVVVLSNPVGSNQVYKVTAMYISNIHGSNAGAASVDHYRATVARRISGAATVVANKLSITPITIHAPVYLEEGDALRVTGDAISTMEYVVSYEVIQ